MADSSTFESIFFFFAQDLFVFTNEDVNKLNYWLLKKREINEN